MYKRIKRRQVIFLVLGIVVAFASLGGPIWAFIYQIRLQLKRFGEVFGGFHIFNWQDLWYLTLLGEVIAILLIKLYFRIENEIFRQMFCNNRREKK